MKLSKNFVVMMMANMDMQTQAVNRLLSGSGVEFYGECPVPQFLESWLPPIRRDAKKFEVFTAICNPSGELTRKLKAEYEVLAKAGHDRQAIEELREKQKKEPTYDEMAAENKRRDIGKELETATLKKVLSTLSGK
jgi:hypothetical protein